LEIYKLLNQGYFNLICSKIIMIRIKIIIIIVFVFSPFLGVMAQWPLLPNGKELNPSDFTRPYSDIAFSGEYINMVQGHIWQWTVHGGFAFGKNKHGLSVKVPFVRTVYPGVEELTGIGDITFRYHLVTYESKMRVRTLASSALRLDISIPTGDPLKGHGAGVPIFMPGFSLAYRPVPQIAILPHMKYFHSFGEIDGDWGGGYPGSIPSDPAMEDNKVRMIFVECLFNYEFNEAWIGLSPMYSYSFIENDGTLSLRPQLGKLFVEKVSINLSASFYIAGRRRLNSLTYFDVRYFF
jgi:hypothetical protein